MSAAAQPTDDRYQTHAWCDYVVTCMQQGYTLVSSPKRGMILTAPHGEWERVRWYVVIALTRSGTIVPDQPDMAKPQVWRIASATPAANATNYGRY